MSKLSLNENAVIFEELKQLNTSDNWWTRLKNDPDIYVDIRKNDEINIYCNGGSLLRIDKKLSNAKINYAFLPVKGDNGTYANCKIDGKNVSLAQDIIIDLDNFSDKKIKEVKRQVKDYYGNTSEKGIQGSYATNWKRNSKEENGFFIDTEFALSNEKSRIDLTFLCYKNPEQPRLYFVELKTQGDPRLFEREGVECIDEQLCKYCDLTGKYEQELIEYYKTLYKIKKELGLMPKEAESINIDNLTIELKPIFLIGDATNEFIAQNAECLNTKTKEYACMAIYRGIGTNHLNFDKIGIKNVCKF